LTPPQGPGLSASSLFVEIRLQCTADGDCVSAALAERRFLVANLVAAGPKKQSRSRGRAIDHFSAGITAQRFRRLAFVVVAGTTDDWATIDVTPELGHGVKYNDAALAIEW
jgi:hypothetical protein